MRRPGQGHRPWGSRLIWICAGDAQLLLEPLLLRLLASRSCMLAAIRLKDSASSPSWSRLWTRMRLPKSPWRSRSVPSEELVDAAGDGPGEHETEDEGDDVHHQEDGGHQGQRLHEHVAHVQRARRESPEEVVGLEMEQHGHEVGLAVRPLPHFRASPGRRCRRPSRRRAREPRCGARVPRCGRAHPAGSGGRCPRR